MSEAIKPDDFFNPHNQAAQAGGDLAGFSDAAEEAKTQEIPESDFELVPAGKYHLEVVSAELRTSGAGHKYVDAQFRVVGGPHDNRRIFELFMLEGNQKAKAIGLRGLALMASVNGHERLVDTTNIVGAHVFGDVKVEKGRPRPDGDGSYPDKNRVRNLKPYVAGMETTEGVGDGEGSVDWF